MNIFVLDSNIQKCAEYHVDKHVVKMILESAQILSTVSRLNGLDQGYKSTHEKHPCTIWTGESIQNWNWLKMLAYHLNEEYKYRFDHTDNHKSYDLIQSLDDPALPNIGLTNFKIALPKYCIVQNNTIESYRKYYLKEKNHIFKWTKRSVPNWIIQT